MKQSKTITEPPTYSLEYFKKGKWIESYGGTKIPTVKRAREIWKSWDEDFVIKLRIVKVEITRKVTPI